MRKFIILALLLGGCIARDVSKHGYYIDPDDVKTISVGLDNKESIVKLIDYPLNTSYFDQDKWVYYSYSSRQILFFHPKVYDQQVLVIKFDPETQLVEQMAYYNIDGKKIEIIEDSAEVIRENKNIIKDILNNIGTVTPSI